MSATFVNNRNRLTGAMTIIEDWSKMISATTSVVHIEVRLERLREIWDEFYENEKHLNDAFPEEESMMAEFEAKYLDTKSNFLIAIREKQTHVDPPADLNVTPLINQLFDEQRTFLGNLNSTVMNDRPVLNDSISLPKITIDKFDGEYRNWPSFEDSYLSSIHNNASLSNIVKFKLLKRLLSDGPTSLIKNLTETEANYNEAWTKLKARFDKKKRILTSYISTFLDLPAALSGRSPDIRSLSDKADELLIGIRTMGTAAEYRDGWIIQILLRKLDAETKQAWSQESVKTDYPKVTQFFDFLNLRCDGLDDGPQISSSSKEKISNIQPRSKAKPIIRAMPTNTISSSQKCLFCDGFHSFRRCFKFRKLSTVARLDFVKQRSLCLNCLQPGHQSPACPAIYNCRVCDQRHNTWLHNYSTTASVQPSTSSALSTNSNSQSFQSVSDPQLPSSVNALNSCTTIVKKILTVTSPRIAALPTAFVIVRDRFGRHQFANALLDSGSQSTFVTERLVQRLGLERFQSSIPVSGLGSAYTSTTRGLVELSVSSRISCNWLTFQAYVLSKLVTLQSFDVSDVLHSVQAATQLHLADPHLGQKKDIDILFGADIFFDLLNPKKVMLSPGLQLQSTRFGWIVVCSHQSNSLSSLPCTFSDEEINKTLQRFWELEQPPTASISSPEDLVCEQNFNTTVHRNNVGRYVVSLPFRSPRVNLGNSLSMAEKRLLSMERRFSRNHSLASEYSKFMDDYLRLGHMERIPVDEIKRMDSECFYLPHHCVLKEDGQTTKIRVVFDGSAKSTSGVSLNDLLIVGPTIQDDLVSLITRFRQHRIVFTADVEKMYRQVLITPTDCDFQRIVWRSSPNDTISHFRLKTVTYGTSSAPYLAVRTLHRIAEDNEAQYPLTTKIIKSDFYVDDLLTGCDTLDEATRLFEELLVIMGGAGFSLCKWKSNSCSMLAKIPDSLKEPNLLNFEDESLTVKTLGLQWNHSRDVFCYKITIAPNETYSKRKMLSEMSKIFDPLGWVSPCTITLKLLFQKLWTLKIGWDDELPTAVKNEWCRIKQQLPGLETVELPRHLGLSRSVKEVEIHGFCDSSELAYSAVVYLRVLMEDGHIISSLVVAKTKVAPLKQISLPRLELCGAGLLIKLIKFVSSKFETFNPKYFGWTDSKIVLAWLSELPRTWKTFVANRVAEIIDVMPRNLWSHVSSKDNPADCATRGVDPYKLRDFNLWWNGPPWLIYPKSQWPSDQVEIPSTNLEERPVVVAVQTNADVHVVDYLLNKYSSYQSVRTTLAFIFKFRYRKTSWVDLLRLSDKTIIRHVQQQEFGNEIHDLVKTGEVGRNSRLRNLVPFIDGDSILRVSGRLNQLDLSYDFKHPIILSARHRFTELIVKEAHFSHLHAGPTLLTSVLRHKYWILDVRNVVRHFVFKCVTCHRQKQSSSHQLMGALPKSRITTTRPFYTCGIDYAGPITLKSRHGRGRVPEMKGYIAIFICFTTKAVHLELVSDMTAEAFVAALRRMISRRGIPAKIVCDNGTNFVGSKKILRTLFDSYMLENEKLITSFLSQNMISFSFIPAKAPHFGGLWESNVRSVEFHLKRVTGNSTLTFEEMATLLAQIEATLNSRPLCPMTNNPDDFTYLTPGHFLVGEPPTCIPEPNLEQIPMSHLSRWQNIQMRVQGFWKSWSMDYLHNLQTRPKWQFRQPNLQPGDVVLIKEENIPPTKWMMARVLEVHPGADGLVRVAKIKTMSGELIRPVVKLSRLPLDQFIDDK